jgi:hypothetical protein
MEDGSKLIKNFISASPRKKKLLQRILETGKEEEYESSENKSEGE